MNPHSSQLRVLLRYLYTQELPGAEDGGEGLVAGEMAKAADYFQAGELYEHCVEQFKGGLRVGNVVERLVQAHDSGLPMLEETALGFLKDNVLVFQVGPSLPLFSSFGPGCAGPRCFSPVCLLRTLTRPSFAEGGLAVAAAADIAARPDPFERDSDHCDTHCRHSPVMGRDHNIASVSRLTHCEDRCSWRRTITPSAAAHTPKSLDQGQVCETSKSQGAFRRRALQNDCRDVHCRPRCIMRDTPVLVLVAD